MLEVKYLWNVYARVVLAYCRISALGGCGLVSLSFILYYILVRLNLFPLIDSLGVGQGGNIGVFLMGTKSQIDRSIPRGIHP